MIAKDKKGCIQKSIKNAQIEMLKIRFNVIN